jgi:glycerol-3-phosphate dehydrogenase subunit B
MRYDVAVAGAGFAGLSAAYAAVKKGKKTAVIARGAGNYSSSSGAFEMLGHIPGRSEAVTKPFDSVGDLAEASEGHPYLLMGKEWLREASSIFLEMTNEIGIPYKGSPDVNIMIPTAIGALYPVCMTPEQSFHQVTEKEGIAVVGITELQDFFPSLLAKALGKRLGRDIAVKWVSLDVESGRGLNGIDCARLLEKAEIRSKIAEQMKDGLNHPDLVIFPAVLGFHHHGEVRRHLEEAVQAPILEVPTLPPVVTACRLGDALRAWLLNSGVDFYSGVSACMSGADGKICSGLKLSFKGSRSRVISAGAFVLATGGILGEGLTVYPDSVKEEVFDLPVDFPKPWTSPDFLDKAGQPMSRAGVRVNRRLQPLERGGGVVFENVFAAGSILSGYDPHIEKSGTGVAFCSGFRAGLSASGEEAANE